MTQIYMISVSNLNLSKLPGKIYKSQNDYEYIFEEYSCEHEDALSWLTGSLKLRISATALVASDL